MGREARFNGIKLNFSINWFLCCYHWFLYHFAENCFTLFVTPIHHFQWTRFSFAPLDLLPHISLSRLMIRELKILFLFLFRPLTLCTHLGPTIVHNSAVIYFCMCCRLWSVKYSLNWASGFPIAYHFCMSSSAFFSNRCDYNLQLNLLQQGPWPLNQMCLWLFLAYYLYQNLILSFFKNFFVHLYLALKMLCIN